MAAPEAVQGSPQASWWPASEAIRYPLDADLDCDELWRVVHGQEETPRAKLPFPDWHRSAACVGAAEKTYFGARDTTERPAVSMADISAAKNICNECPVFRVCLESALGLRGGPREEYGIWAGTSGRTRKRIWELIDQGKMTAQDIVDDICSGFGAKYESSITLRPVPVIEPIKSGVA